MQELQKFENLTSVRIFLIFFRRTAANNSSFKFLYICFILLIHCLDSWKCNHFTLFMQYLVVRGSSSVFLNEWRSLHSIVWQQMVQIRVFLMIYDMKVTADVKQIYTLISRFLDEFTKLYSLSYIKTYRPI